MKHVTVYRGRYVTTSSTSASSRLATHQHTFLENRDKASLFVQIVENTLAWSMSLSFKLNSY